METPQSPFEHIPEGETPESVADALAGREILDEGGNLIGTIKDVIVDEQQELIKEVVVSDGSSFPAQVLTFTDGRLYVDRSASTTDEPTLPSEGERLPADDIATDMEGYVRDARAAEDSGRMSQGADEMGTDEVPDMDFEPTRPLEERKQSTSTERRTYEEVEEEMRDKFESTPGEREEERLHHPDERRGYDRSEEE